MNFINDCNVHEFAYEFDVEHGPDTDDRHNALPLSLINEEGGFDHRHPPTVTDADDNSVTRDGGHQCIQPAENRSENTAQATFPTSDPIKDYINSKRNKNTVKKTDLCYKRFRDWLVAPPREETRNLLDIPPSAMDRYVAGFLIEIKKPNGDDYEPDTLTSFHRGINRKLDDLGYKFSLVKSREFSTSKKVLETRRRELKQLGKGNKPMKADCLTEAEEEKLWATGQLGTETPLSLINTVWYYTTKCFGLRGCHERRQLEWGDVKIVNDENNGRFLVFNERETKTRTGNSTHLREFPPKIFENKQNPQRCPVLAFETYMQKRPVDMNFDGAPFYLAVIKNPRANKPDSPWYKKSLMGYHRIDQMMPRMAQAAGLSGHKTNHSVRRTMCTQLFQAGVAPNMIAQLSGHKNLQSINNYAVASLDQQKQMSQILQGNRNKDNVNAISTDGSRHAPDPVQSPQPRGLSVMTNQRSVVKDGASSIFAGANFFGSVYINVSK